LRENRPPSCDKTKAGGQQAGGIVLAEFAIPAASEGQAERGNGTLTALAEGGEGIGLSGIGDVAPVLDSRAFDRAPCKERGQTISIR